ncbi:MAG: DUF222 domain-containing protein [Microthrixaceae bacterium]
MAPEPAHHPTPRATPLRHLKLAPEPVVVPGGVRQVEQPLGERLVEVGWRASDDHHEVVRLAAEFAGTDLWKLAGASSAAQWISEHLDIALRTAREWIAVGKALAELPLLDAALGSRQLSYAKVRILVRAVTAESEAELIALAGSVPAGQLGKAVAAWSCRHEPDHEREVRHRAARGLSWRIEPDGLTTGTLRLPSALAGAVRAVIDAQVMRAEQRADQAEVADGAGAPDVPGASRPSLAQQRVDALVEVLCGGGGGVSAEVVLHVRGDGVSLDDGTPVSDSAVLQALPEGFLRALIHDADGRPVNASGRRRHPTARQRRVVKERDRCCVDCGSDDLLEFDHVPDYRVSGRTVTDELVLRCAACHRARHARSGNSDDVSQVGCGPAGP